MITRRQHEKAQASLQRAIDRAGEEASKNQRRTAYEVELCIRGIWDAYRTSRHPRLGESVASFDISKLPIKRWENTLRTGHFSDALVLAGVTKGFLEDRVNRLIVRGEQDAVYSRRPINVDCQAMGSRPVSLEGIDAIASDQVAFVSVAALAGALSMEAEYGWKHAYSPGEIDRVRLNIAPA